jgi:aryl-alcohol dehydrogenase-like predicted oxidoreductase
LCDVEEAIEAMAELEREGKTRFIGVSNYNAHQMGLALGTARFQSNQPVYNLFERGVEREDMAFCEREGIGVLAHSPLAKGLLSGKYDLKHRFSSDDERSNDPRFQGQRFAQRLAAADRLKEIAYGKGLTLAQLAIAWLLRIPAVTCVLFGAKTTAQVEENVRAADVGFSDEELDWIEAALTNAAKI